MAYQDRVIQPIGLTSVLQNDSILKLYNKIKSKTGGRELLGKLADDYLAFLHRRHASKSVNGWPRLSARTIAGRKDTKRRVNRPVHGPFAVLRDQDQLFSATAKGGRGQVRKLDVSTMTVRAGVDGTTVYYDPRRGQLGKRARRTLGQLVRYHAAAQGSNNKKREIVVPPNEWVLNNFRHNARNWIESLTT